MSAGWPNKWTGMIAFVRGVLGRGNEGHGYGDHFVSCPDPEREQCQPKRIRAVADSDGVGGSTKRSEILLEPRDIGTPGERRVVNDFLNDRDQFLAHRTVVSFQV